MDAQLKERRVIKLSLMRLKTQMETLAKKKTMDLETLSKIESLMTTYFQPSNTNFENLTNQILSSLLEGDEEHATLENQLLTDLDTVRDIGASYEAKIKFFQNKLAGDKNRESITTAGSSLTASSVPTPQFTKIKEIEPPTFNGDLTKFFEWKNLFENLIHSRPTNELSNVQKLYYLKKSMIGDAEGVISDFALSDEAYVQAWNYVLSRFEKRRSIIRALFRNLKNLEPIKNEKGLQKLLDKTNSIIRGLKAAGEEVNETFSRFIAYHVCTKLDSTTLKDWENSLSSVDSYPQFEQLNKFLQSRAFAAEDRQREFEISNQSSKDSKDSKDSKKVNEKKSFAIATKNKCVLCSQTHYLNQCSEFKAKKPQDRYEVVKSNRLCLICFNPGHNVNDCSSKFRCHCGQKHSSLLHFEFKNSQSNKSSVQSEPFKNSVEKNPEPNQKVNEKSAYSCARATQEKVVLLPSAIVKFNCHGVFGRARILLDSCSQPTLISDTFDTFVKKFKLPTSLSDHPGSIKGVGDDAVLTSNCVGITLSSRSGNFHLAIEADIVPATSIAYAVNFSMSPEILDRLKKFPLADPDAAHSNVDISKVDMILGAEYYEKCLLNETCSIGDLSLRLTKFGWTVSGVVPQPVKFPTHFSGCTIQQIDKNLSRFWEIEELSAPVSTEIRENELCEQHFLQNYSIEKDGKFIVKLPFKTDRLKIANNRACALASLKRVENKLSEKLKKDYTDFLKQYLSMGHMSVAEPISLEMPVYYIPHRAVVRETSSTTPVRVVFNASSHIQGEISLNDALMCGPVIQRDLFDILITMRSYKFVFCADISKMYRMVWVHENDRNMQRILWRESVSSPVTEYRLNTVTYGTVPASYLATKCLALIADDLHHDYPEAAQVVRQNFYMDDLIAGSHSVENMCSLQKVIHAALFARGFELRKYSSNSQKFLNGIPTELQAVTAALTIGAVNPDLGLAVLGVAWNSDSDSYSVKLNIESFSSEVVPTKRIVLSYISRTFDPLGFVSPITVRGKLILQFLWLEGKSWDDPISESLRNVFVTYMRELEVLRSLEIPRVLNNFNSECEIVAFCDASEKAYCAVLYIRSVDENKKVMCRMICSKTRVAPIRSLTIPKLELMAANLLVDLVERVATNLRINTHNIHAFTDSTVVLCWLSKPATNWKVFVANRVQKIVSKICFQKWHYVPSNHNPADLATRGLNASDILNCNLWFDGPMFLKESNVFSYFNIPNIDTHNVLEKRKLQISLNIVIALNLFEQFSDFLKLIRIIAYMLRFFNACKNQVRAETLSITNFEFNDAMIVAIRMSQMLCFSSDIERLKQNLPLKKKSSLLSLNPFLDEFGILRVGGRLEKSAFSFPKKHPMIISAKSHFVRLLIRHLHEKYFHAGRSFLSSFLSSQYWVVGGRTNLLKFIIRSCVMCSRIKAKQIEPIMGQLPASRLTVSHPFTYCGVDLAGPFTCKCVAHRTTRYYKIYVAIFVCLTVRAVHIELVSDLSTPKFMEALQRFISRRGVPFKLFSDNGTNFVGTNNFFNQNKEKIVEMATKENFEWFFIPPRAPNFGGIWEAAVKAAKRHLLNVTKGAILTFEEYSTLFTKVEAILNSRPLAYKGHIEQGNEVLTPAHFLVGQSLLTLPVLDVSPMTLSSRLQQVQTLIKSFWVVWSKDYINQLQQRSKWKTSKPNFHEGQIVLVRDQNESPFNWPLGVIVKVHPGADEVIRVADVRFNNAVRTRAVSTLIPLPVDSEPDGSAGWSLFRKDLSHKIEP